jgi:peptide/nickel transport system substrate-binding protein
VNISRKLWRALCAAVAVGVVAVVVSACGSSGSSSSPTSPSGGSTPTVVGGLKQTGPGLTEATSGSGAKLKGGTVTFAEAPAAPPNYIFPMYSAEYCNVNNIGQLNEISYKPLYWFGDNNSPTVDYDQSIGKKPVFSDNDKVVTVHLNNYKWSDGETVSARDLVFWMNVLKADPAKNWCGYIPGEFPDNIVSWKAVNPSTFQITLNGSYNPTWVLYNELAEIYPMPMAWDRTSLSQPIPSPNSKTAADLTKAGAEKVYEFLNAQSQKISSWGSSPIWGVVDGAFKVASTTSNGGVTFVPNKTYSGSPKPTISRFIEVPYTSESSMVNEIKSQGTSALTVAYIPSEDQPLTASFKSEGYDIDQALAYQSTFVPLNQNAPKVAVIFRQLYARQALQHLVDQSGWISHFLHGEAVPTYGPVPSAPPNPMLAGSSETDRYPFSIPAAAKLLKDNGWKVVPGGVSTCIKPGTGAGECGTGITKGQPFAFTINYESDVTSVQEEMEDLQSQASKVGIKLTLTAHPYDDVASAAEHCSAGTGLCDWDAENYGAGWLWGVQHYPSGDALVASQSFDNFANYSNKKMDKLIHATVVAKPSQERAAMAKFEKYADAQVPYMWMPDSVGAFGYGTAGTLISNKLGGFTANAFGIVMPQDYYLTK